MNSAKAPITNSVPNALGTVTRSVPRGACCESVASSSASSSPRIASVQRS